MTKVIAYTPLLYGACYLGSAIRSVINSIDEYYVLYSPTASHGHPAGTPSPDSREELYAIAEQAAGSKLRWIDTPSFAYEGQQRDYIFAVAPDAGIVIPLDYDEIWQEYLINFAINTALEGKVRRLRVPFRHYWRSFYKCVLHDPAYPDRVINTRNPDGEDTLHTTMAINHMGYAIPPELMRYKWSIHGHKNELRRDVDFFTDIYEANRQFDMHPVGSDAWNAEDVDPFARPYFMSDWMMEHPFAKLGVIP